MTDVTISSKIVVELADGSVKVFDNKADAMDFVRRPKILEALKAFTSDDDLSNWLLDNQEIIEVAFETGSIRRVTKSEHKKLDEALKHLLTIEDKKLDFLKDAVTAIKDSFRWPSVKRMSDEEKMAAARNTLTAATGQEDLALWIISNKDAILEAYKAGIEKREVSPKAKEGLAAYQAKKAAEKAAIEKAKRDAAEAEGPAALAAYEADLKARMEAKK